MTAGEWNAAFKEKLGKALNQLDKDLTINDVSAIIREMLLKHTDLPTGYLIDHEILYQSGMHRHKHIYISCAEKMPAIETGGFTIKFLEQRSMVSKETIPYLQILDLIQICRTLSEPDLREMMKNLKRYIEYLSYEERKLLIQLARKYPVCVRAVLGFLLEDIRQATLSGKLLQTVSPIALLRYKQKIHHLLTD